jgi:hypothetical protein
MEIISDGTYQARAVEVEPVIYKHVPKAFDSIPRGIAMGFKSSFGM